MIAHHEFSELLALFALDAVDSEEYEEIERHLASCPRCQAELDAHREVAAALGNSVEPLPEELWDRISSRLTERQDERLPSVPHLFREGLGEGDFEKGTSDLLRASTPVRSPRGRLAVVASLAVAAAAVATVFGIRLVGADDKVAHLQGAIGESSRTAVVAALETPGSKVVDLDNSDKVELAQFVLIPDGRGYLVVSHLPVLSPRHTYQLWGVIGGRPISLGLIGRSPNLVTFTLAGSPSPSKLGVSVEPAGGSVAPSGPMVASGTV